MSVNSLEETIGFKFRHPDMLRHALTHKSHASEHDARECNERLEFLGDSILAAVVASELYRHYPAEDEGKLSKLKSLLVSRSSLARWAKELNLGKHIFLGSGEESSGGRVRPSILSNTMEAIIGAVYLDGGFDAASALIVKWFLEQQKKIVETDYKSQLQELIQKKHKVPPQYELARASGPDHDKTFVVTVKIGRQILGTGAGKSKKEAEQAAAEDALCRISTSLRTSSASGPSGSVPRAGAPGAVSSASGRTKTKGTQ